MSERETGPVTRVPPAITIVEEGRGAAQSGYREHAGKAPLIVVRRWRRPSTYLELLVVTAWVAYLVWLPLSVGWPRAGRDGMVAFSIFGGGLAFVGVYHALAMFLNQTEITVTDEWILVRHGPIRWPGGVDVRVARLAALVCEQHGLRAARGEAQTPPVFRLQAVLKNRTSVTLVSRAPDLEQVVFLKHRIERRLGISAAAASSGARG
jgi:hypothetical protein